MNERIRELADKIWAEEYWDKPNTDKLLPAQLNRFAKLIVKECGNWIVDNAGAMEHLGPSYFAKAMQKDFGVEK
jgi:hypothetical protein